MVGSAMSPRKLGSRSKDPATALPMAKSLALAPVDVDNDGWIDLVVANDTVQNFLFHNEHNGTFREESAPVPGVAYDAYGLTRGAMGIDSARFRNDDTLGIAIGNFANEMMRFMWRNATRCFSRMKPPAKVSSSQSKAAKVWVVFLRL